MTSRIGSLGRRSGIAAHKLPLSANTRRVAAAGGARIDPAGPSETLFTSTNSDCWK
jgi:hypothetical protein